MPEQTHRTKYSRANESIQIMIPSDRISTNLSRHFQILGISWVLYGILRLVLAVWLITFSNTATLMFGALLNRVADPFTMMTAFHFFYSFLIVFSGAIGILGIMAGLALLGGSRAGKLLTLVVAFLSLSSVPLGTTLGIYSLIVLLSWTPQSNSVTVTGASIADLKRQPMAT
jgi:hypothetical protein